jgi:hypothetical protein
LPSLPIPAVVALDHLGSDFFVMALLLSGTGSASGGVGGVLRLRHGFQGDCAVMSLPCERGETLSATELAAWAGCFSQGSWQGPLSHGCPARGNVILRRCNTSKHRKTLDVTMHSLRGTWRGTAALVLI